MKKKMLHIPFPSPPSLTKHTVYTTKSANKKSCVVGTARCVYALCCVPKIRLVVNSKNIFPSANRNSAVKLLGRGKQTTMKKKNWSWNKV